MSTSATAKALPSSARAIDGLRDDIDERAMVQGVGQRVAPGRLHERLGLAGDPALGGAEDQEQDEGGDERRRERDDDDVPADLVELGEDRHGITPDPDDADHLAVEAEREVLAQDGLGREGRAGGIARRGVHDVHDGAVAGTGLAERGGNRRGGPAQRGVVGEDDGPIGPPDLDAQDRLGRDERLELAFDDGSSVARLRARREIVG